MYTPPFMKFKSGVNGRMGFHLHVVSKSGSYLRACIQNSPTFITVILSKQVNLSTWRVMGMQHIPGNATMIMHRLFSFCNKTLSVPARRKRFCLWIMRISEWESIMLVIWARPDLLQSRSVTCITMMESSALICHLGDSDSIWAGFIRES